MDFTLRYSADSAYKSGAIVRPGGWLCRSALNIKARGDVGATRRSMSRSANIVQNLNIEGYAVIVPVRAASNARQQWRCGAGSLYELPATDFCGRTRIHWKPALRWSHIEHHFQQGPRRTIHDRAAVWSDLRVVQRGAIAVTASAYPACCNIYASGTMPAALRQETAPTGRADASRRPPAFSPPAALTAIGPRHNRIALPCHPVRRAIDRPVAGVLEVLIGAISAAPRSTWTIVLYGRRCSTIQAGSTLRRKHAVPVRPSARRRADRTSTRGSAVDNPRRHESVCDCRGVRAAMPTRSTIHPPPL